LQKFAKRFLDSRVDDDESSLSFACGCYLFAIRASKGFKPWYVGLAGKQSFQHECFAAQKINIYNDVLSNRRGTPVLFLLSKRTKGGKFVRPSSKQPRDIAYLETLMIGAALEKNSALMNIKNTKYLRLISVPGLINTPKRKPTGSEQQFKKAIK
jgi:hypothetical protein